MNWSKWFIVILRKTFSFSESKSKMKYSRNASIWKSKKKWNKRRGTKSSTLKKLIWIKFKTDFAIIYWRSLNNSKKINVIPNGSDLRCQRIESFKVLQKPSTFQKFHQFSNHQKSKLIVRALCRLYKIYAVKMMDN